MKNTSFIPVYCLIIICSIFGLWINLAFATPLPVVATTCEATDVTSNSATLHGKVGNYTGDPVQLTIWFMYGTARDNYSDTSTSATQIVSGGTTIPVGIGISGLSPNTTYYYRIVEQSNEFGESMGREKSFTTLSATPTVTVTPTPFPTSNCTIPGRVINAITKKGIKNAWISGTSSYVATTDADGYYSWYDDNESRLELCCGGAYTLTASADGYKSLSQLIDIEPCSPRTLDFELQPITTPTPIVTPTPWLITEDATNITSNSATLNATVPLVVGYIYFEYGTVSGSYASSVDAVREDISDKVNANIIGLSPATTYYNRVVVFEKPPGGYTYGNEKSFTTLAATPTVTPTPVCEAETIEAFPKTLKLRKEESGNMTVTVTSSEGCPVAGETVTSKIKSGKKRISISPQSTDTNVNGQAIFTITATKKTGNAKVKFETTSGLKTTVTVKVRR
ncbi:MAG: hypothetical protein DYG83_06675 [Candidatus Brocadia sp. AMX2]|uniref:Fibronectin type-III domain-containing protein n=1 Tax=Candidatus Brocadia sinica JPN1 TaxID=1197129 RepID=A0ABQ0JSN5_9BACT|nr:MULTISPECIES: carboxypeptidase regulatory-like domain-containing protein [Brocadia]MBC6931379.1 hypothetical protein [Candidatus Brocadia sp.]MBL1168726.1 hypothetical protein [Candidatus Brocadia sp. AMX1]NOG43325.1 hypothetical protein [Planctomycetota bacterium]NUO06379.1 hypothetical protein [Candidatus Brocadia sinica]KAA0245884.1 MAG: hypothetical protein EDM70_00520 [Candidatus Brocadia sp. AMX2]